MALCAVVEVSLVCVGNIEHSYLQDSVCVFSQRSVDDNRSMGILSCGFFYWDIVVVWVTYDLVAGDWNIY